MQKFVIEDCFTKFIRQFNSNLLLVLGLSTSTKKWLSISLAAIILPITVLATLKFSGILPEPQQPETITLEAIKWEFTRPNQTVDIFYVVEAFYNNDGLTASPEIHIWDYVDRPYGGYYYDSLYMEIRTNATVAISNGFVENVYITLHKDNQSSIGLAIARKLDYDAENLSLIDFSGASTWGSKAYFNLKGMGQPRSAYFSAGAFWLLPTPNSQTHWLNVSFELTYYNGTAYKKVIQPFQLNVIGG
jgi:hypothetical protein